MNLDNLRIHNLQFIKKLQFKDNIRILDIGTGSGYCAVQLAKEMQLNNIKGKIVGIDIYKNRGEEFLKNAESKNVSNFCKFKKMNAFKLNFINNSFDYVIAFKSIHPIISAALRKKNKSKNNLKSPEKELLLKLFKNIKRVLTPNGKIVIIDIAFTENLSIPYKLGILTWLKLHYRIIPLNNLITMLRKSGFKIQELSISDSASYRNIDEIKKNGFLKPGFFRGYEVKNIKKIVAEHKTLIQKYGIREQIFNIIGGFD